MALVLLRGLWKAMFLSHTRARATAACLHYMLGKGGRVTESAKGGEGHQLGEALQEASAVLEMRKQQPKARSLGMSGSLI